MADHEFLQSVVKRANSAAGDYDCSVAIKQQNPDGSVVVVMGSTEATVSLTGAVVGECSILKVVLEDETTYIGASGNNLFRVLYC